MFQEVLMWIYNQLSNNKRINCKLVYREDQSIKNVVVYFDGTLKLSIAALSGIDNSMSIESLFLDNNEVNYGENLHEWWSQIVGEKRWSCSRELINTINSMFPTN